MHRILIFIAVVFLLYLFTSEINSAARKTDEIALGTYETLKEKANELLEKSKKSTEVVNDEESNSELSTTNEPQTEDSTSKVEDEEGELSWWEKLWKGKDKAVEKYEDTKERYLELKRDLDQKYQELQKALKEIEEAKKAIDELISREEEVSE